MEEFRILQATLAVRKEPSHRAELVNQLLFGEKFIILEQDQCWMKIESSHDQYLGWVEEKINLEPQTGIDFKYIISKALAYINYREDIVLLPFGARCPSYMLKHNSNKNDYLQTNLSIEQSIDLIKSQFLHSPYLWGGRTVMGIDCSGLTQLFGCCIGVNLKRDAWQQAEEAKPFVEKNDLKLGDLVFFKNENDHITHVGIYLSEDKILHASGRVRIDLLSNNGIVNGQTGKLTHVVASYKSLVM